MLQICKFCCCFFLCRKKYSKTLKVKQNTFTSALLEHLSALIEALITQVKKLTGGMNSVSIETHVLSTKIAIFELVHVQFLRKFVLNIRKSSY